MSQCVPSWELDDNPSPSRLTLRAHFNSNSLASDVPMSHYEVAELTWENGQIAMHGLGPPRVPNKPPPAATATTPTAKYTWEKPSTGGTLESIVDQATGLPHKKAAAGERDSDELVPWFNHHRAVAVSAPATMVIDALVPCSARAKENNSRALEEIGGTCVVGCSTRVGSNTFENSALKRARVARVPEAAEWSSRDHSVSGSATFERDSRQLTLDTCERELGVCGFTSTSLGSAENASSAKQRSKATTNTADDHDHDHDSVCHSRPQRDSGDEEDKKKRVGKSSISTKRSRAAAIHNQSERKRRDKINQRMKTLQKLVPNSSKTDKASMLDEVIEYLKQLQAQVHVMSRMNMSTMMLPMALQQQLQLSMMAPIGMGMGIGMGTMGVNVMDMNAIARTAPNITGIPPVLHPTAATFMALPSWDAAAAAGDRLTNPTAVLPPDPMSAFFACQSQPMTMDAYTRLAALYQQMHQPPPPGSKN